MRRNLVFCTFLLILASAAQAEPPPESAAIRTGERAPIFSLVSAHRDLISYDKDYYGLHHLILTFFPAAFTPV